MQSSNIKILDNQHQQLLSRVINHKNLSAQSSKHVRIRINAWINKLQSILSNNIWRKNRNNYLRLLYIMLQYKQIIEPFTSMPQQQIQTLHKHHINCILLKLTTRIKQRERDKQNKIYGDVKLNQLTPTQMWNNLENRTLRTQNSTNSLKTVLIVDNQLTHKKNRRIMESGTTFGNNIQVLSPISQGNLHFRQNSNLSACNFSTIQKFKECNNQTIIVNTQNSQDIKQNDRQNMKIKINNEYTESKITQQVKYFKKNRHNRYLSNISDIQQKSRSRQCDEEKDFYEKMFTFLKKYKKQFEKDKQYSQIVQQLQQNLKNQPTQSKSSKIFSFTPQKIITTPHKIILNTDKSNEFIHKQQQIIQYQQDYEQQQINNGENIQNCSYNYMNGEYSQYSEVQIDQGISPSRIIHIYDTPIQGQGYKKKSALDNLCYSASQAIRSIRNKIRIDDPQDFCRKISQNI